jgi:AraC-like DNA-binding protein
MPLRVHKPGLPLSQYVELMWWIASDGTGPARQRVYPDGTMALVIHLKKSTVDFFIDAEAYSVRVPTITGPYSRSFHIDGSRPSSMIGILFRPGAARAFFPVAAHELHNIDIALSDLYPDDADRLLNDVCAANDADARFAVLERYLCRRLREAMPIHPAVRYAVGQLMREGGMANVRRIQVETGVSHTRMIQLFREHVGLTPKLFCRVRRFRAVLQGIGKGSPVNWAELAAECGYFDQAHLIRDFRVFAGMTPATYRRETPERDRQLLAALANATS